MADYYSEFSFIMANVTQEEAEWLVKHYAEGEYKEDDQEYQYSFDMQIQEDPDRQAWFHDGDGQPNVMALVDFLQKFLKKFRKGTEVFFEWSNTCSSHRTDGFGGGAALVTATSSAFRSTGDLQDILQSELTKPG